jgi:uncharacterized protein (TIGR00255 family)
MTGFAAAAQDAPHARVQVTVKSVNHRFLDVALKAPASLAAIEPRVRAVLQRRFVRGRIEIAIACEAAVRPVRDVVLDEGLLRQLAEAVDRAAGQGLVTGRLSASDVLRIPQVLEVRAAAADATPSLPDEVADVVEAVVSEAAEALRRMRETEGRLLAADLDARLATLGEYVDRLDEAARSGQAELASRLRERLAGLAPDVAGDPAAVAQEIVRLVARSDVAEEVVRLRGHLVHWRALADGADPCGRQLDFLVQEMHREFNTLGAKAEGHRAGELVIAAKVEVERIREQVQNVE